MLKPGLASGSRAITRDDLPRLCEFNNDLAVELAGGGDLPLPQSLARLQAEFDQDAAKGGRDKTFFAIEADGKLVGGCGLFNASATHQTAELGIGIGDKGTIGARATAASASGFCSSTPSAT
ncbi:MAG: GNAT family N-acetyltransferase [Gemmataceae bacterium]